MAKSKAVGIDLGTTYSAMAWVDEHGAGKLIPNSEGDLLTPSVVLFEDDATIVGKEAKKVAVVKADRVASCVKRDMGKPVFNKAIRGQYLPPEVIQSYILSKLRHDVTRSIGPDFQAIITVPAFFDEPRRKATYDAGEMAGLKVLDIVNEPTAAALAFGQDLGYLTRYGAPKQRMNVVVYDLGGGTFDVTLIDMQAGDLKTLATDGDVQLGGHDWDMRIVDHMAEAFLAEHGIDPRSDLTSLQRMLADAEEAKHTLSARQQTKLKVAHQGRSSTVELTRAEFEQKTADLLERTRFTTRNLLRTAGLTWKDIGRILLTGGSTRMPSVIKMLKELSGLDPDHTVNPDEAVARGAAIYANYLLSAKGETGHAPTFDVTNVNAHSLGIEGTEPGTLRKVNTILIPRNSPLPAKRSEQCITQFENQRTVVIQVLEGESRNPQECTAIGRTVINDLPPGLPQGWPVYVEYQYGINGRLSVTARVEGTDRIVHLELEREASMSKDRVKQWGRSVTAGGGLDDFDDAVQAEINALTQQQGTLQAQAAGRPMALGSAPNAGASGIGLGGSGIHSASGIQSGSGVGSKVIPTVPTVPSASGIMPGASSIHGPDASAGLPRGKAGPTHGGGKVGAGPPLVAGMPPPPGVSGIMSSGSGVATAAPPGGKVVPTVPTVPTTGPAGSATNSPAASGAKPAPAAKPAAAPAAESGGDLILYVVFITLGIILGYYVLVWAAPAANFLRLNLPGLPPVSSGDVSPATPAASPETSQLSPPSSLPHAYDSAATRLVAGDAAAPLKDGSRVSAPRA